MPNLKCLCASQTERMQIIYIERERAIIFLNEKKTKNLIFKKARK